MKTASSPSTINTQVINKKTKKKFKKCGVEKGKIAFHQTLLIHTWHLSTKCSVSKFKWF